MFSASSKFYKLIRVEGILTACLVSITNLNVMAESQREQIEILIVSVGILGCAACGHVDTQEIHQLLPQKKFISFCPQEIHQLFPRRIEIVCIFFTRNTGFLKSQ